MSEQPQARHRIATLLPPFSGPQAHALVAEGIGWIYDLDKALYREVLLSRMPDTAPDDVLSYICRDRRVRRGPTEPTDALIPRLRQFVQTWSLAGLPMGYLIAVQAYLAPAYPRIRVVTRGGVWYTLEEGAVGRMLGLDGYEPLPMGIGGRTHPAERLRASGLYTRYRDIVNNWDYDSISNPSFVSRWWHCWTIIYPGTFTHKAGYDTGWKYNEKFSSWGLDYAWGDARVLRQIQREFLPHKARCVATIITDDSDDFDPLAYDGSSWPDGYWGWEVKPDGMGGAVSARRTDLRYMFTEPNE